MAYDRPKRLAEKLLQIRLAFGLSQSEMIRRLELGDAFTPPRISAFEIGHREPGLLILLKYARLAGISTDVLIDDELDLPSKIPSGGSRKS